MTGLVCSGITGSFHSGLGGRSGSGLLDVDRVTRRGSDEGEKNWGGS